MFYLGFNICLAILFTICDKQTLICIVQAKIRLQNSLYPNDHQLEGHQYEGGSRAAFSRVRYVSVSREGLGMKDYIYIY